MPKYLSITILILVLLLPLLAYGQGTPKVISLPNPLASDTFEELVDALINWLLIITSPIVALLVVYAGAQTMFSGGSAEQASQAKKIILYALIGYGVILTSKILVGVIKALFD